MPPSAPAESHLTHLRFLTKPALAPPAPHPLALASPSTHASMDPARVSAGIRCAILPSIQTARRQSPAFGAPGSCHSPSAPAAPPPPTIQTSQNVSATLPRFHSI